MLARLGVLLGWGQLFKRTVYGALDPALVALISIASFFPIANLTQEIDDMSTGVAPQDVVRIVRDQIEQISESRSGGILTFAFLFTVWSTSTAVLSMSYTLTPPTTSPGADRGGKCA